MYSGHTYAPNGLNQYNTVNPPGTGFDTLTYDARGNLIARGSDSYDYDSLNRLTDADVDGAASSYLYDPLGRLYSVDAVGTSSDRRYLWDGPTLIAEYQGLSGSTISERYVQDQGSLGAPVAVYDGSSVAIGDQLLLATDERGSVTALIEDDGTLAAINSYGPYGYSASGNTGRFGYAGQLWLPEAQLYYMRNRHYDPDLGRFMQTDPIGYEGGMNLYAYVGNDPVNFVDPWGLDNCPDGSGICVYGSKPRSFFGSSFGGLIGGGSGGDPPPPPEFCEVAPSLCKREQEEDQCAAPGSIFESPASAGIAGTSFAYDDVRTNRPLEARGDEYGGRVYLVDGGYSFRPPQSSGSPDSVSFDIYRGDVGSYHIVSHPGGALGTGDPALIRRIGNLTGEQEYQIPQLS